MTPNILSRSASMQIRRLFSHITIFTTNTLLLCYISFSGSYSAFPFKLLEPPYLPPTDISTGISTCMRAQSLLFITFCTINARSRPDTRRNGIYEGAVCVQERREELAPKKGLLDLYPYLEHATRHRQIQQTQLHNQKISLLFSSLALGCEPYTFLLRLLLLRLLFFRDLIWRLLLALLRASILAINSSLDDKRNLDKLRDEIALDGQS